MDSKWAEYRLEVRQMNELLQPRGRGQRTARAGEYYVAAELNRRGAYAVTFTGNMPDIDVMASNADRTRTVNIQVKAKRSKVWQTSTETGKVASKPTDEQSFWVFVDLSDKAGNPNYWVVPDWWIRNNIHEEHDGYLSKHGGVRPKNSNSTHHSITEKRIVSWRNRWDILGLW